MTIAGSVYSNGNRRCEEEYEVELQELTLSPKETGNGGKWTTVAKPAQTCWAICGNDVHGEDGFRRIANMETLYEVDGASGKFHLLGLV